MASALSGGLSLGASFGATPGLDSGSGQDALFSLRAGPFGPADLTVLAFSGREELSGLFDFRIDLFTDLDPSAFEVGVLGLPASFVWQVPGLAPRVIQGVIRSVEERAFDASTPIRYWRVHLVPSAWLLTRRQRSRVFQNQTIADIVKAVLGEIGLEARFQLVTVLPRRTYCVQYQETDWGFVTRLLAEAGLFFHFEPPSGALESLTGGLSSTIGGAASAVGGMLGGVTGGALGDAAAAAHLAETLVVLDSPALSPFLPTAETGLGGLATEAGGAVMGEAAGAIGAGIGGPIGGAVGGAVKSAILSTPELLFRPESAMVEDREVVTRFALRRRVTSNRVELRDYDPQRPLVPFLSQARQGLLGALSSAGAASLVAGGISGSVSAGLNVSLSASSAMNAAMGLTTSELTSLEVYDHHGDFEETQADSTTARQWLEQVTWRAREGHGASFCRRLSPGYLFRLTNHPEDRSNGDYLLTAVKHRGIAPQWSMQTRPDRPVRVYENTFRAVPASIAPRPPRPARRVQQALETALVVGAPGEEIHTDSAGRIKVQFYWDREGTRDAHSSCWLRVMQAWSGPGYGAQFIPRVGMEVVVSFLAGDPDRPMVMGCVPNAATPQPFWPDQDAARSGWRSSSTPGGMGYNELSFEDTDGDEQIFLHAQRDLDEVVEHDHTTTVRNDQRVEVEQNQRIAVGQNQTVSVGLDQTLEVGRQHVTLVGASQVVQIGGSQHTAVAGDMSTAVMGSSELEIERDSVLAVQGHHNLIVGTEHEPKQSDTHVYGTLFLSATEGLELRADRSIRLSVGESLIEVTEQGITLSSKTIAIEGHEQVAMKGKGPSLTLGEQAELLSKSLSLRSSSSTLEMGSSGFVVKGSQVSLNEPPASLVPADEASDPTKSQKLKLAVSDFDLEPYANKTYHLIVGGTKVEGTTDGDGLVDVEVPTSVTQAKLIVWIDDYPEGRTRAYHINLREMPDVATVEGVYHRLKNLGYYTGPEVTEMTEELRAAVRWFQADFAEEHGLALTGNLDDRTGAALAQVHQS